MLICPDTTVAQRLSLTQIPIRSRGVGSTDRVEDVPNRGSAAVWNDNVRRQITQLVSTPEYEDILRPVVERMEKLQPVHCLKEFVNQKVGPSYISSWMIACPACNQLAKWTWKVAPENMHNQSSLHLQRDCRGTKIQRLELNKRFG